MSDEEQGGDPGRAIAKHSKGKHRHQDVAGSQSSQPLTLKQLWEQSLDPPERPTDLIESALFVPLPLLDLSHRGRKVRIVSQVLGYDPSSALLLLTDTQFRADPAKSRSSSRMSFPTILSNISVPLMGMSPAVKDLQGYNDFWTVEKVEIKKEATKIPSKALAKDFESKKKRLEAKEQFASEVTASVRVVKHSLAPPSRPRPTLSLGRGEWVTVVGWLEPDEQDIMGQVTVHGPYAQPLPLILQVIHIRSCRPPPPDAVYRGQLPT